MACVFPPSSALLGQPAPSGSYIRGLYVSLHFLIRLVSNSGRRIGISPAMLKFSSCLLLYFRHYCICSYLLGAQWCGRTRSLCESRPKQLHQCMPTLWLQPRRIGVVGAQECDVEQEAFYVCPVYKTSTRGGTQRMRGPSSNYVMAVRRLLLKAHFSPGWLLVCNSCGVYLHVYEQLVYLSWCFIPSPLCVSYRFLTPVYDSQRCNSFLDRDSIYCRQQHTLSLSFLSVSYFQMNLRSSGLPPHHWVLRGVALVCQIANE